MNKANKHGFLFGLLCPGDWRASESGEPVAYLYNGVQLPPLPEWDKTAYPYAAIFKNIIGTAVLYIFEQKPYVTIKTSVTAALSITSGSKYVYKGANSISNPTNGWNANTEYTATDDQTMNIQSVIWTDFDLLNEDGTVSLSASEPVPVYE